MGAFVHMAMPAASVCDRVCICVFLRAFVQYVVVFIAFGCECMTVCRQVIVFVSASVLDCVYCTPMCVWRATWWRVCLQARVERRARRSMSMSRCGHHSRRATNPLTTRGRTLLANMG